MGWEADKDTIVRDALRSAGLLTNERGTKLVHAVSATIGLWVAEKRDITPLRSQHNHLRGIWELLHQSDPPIGQIRSRFESMPYTSRYYLRRRASRLWPRAFNDQADCEPFSYIQRMGQKQLLRRLPHLIAEGGSYSMEAPGGVTPTIMGITRGLDDGPEGGRPRGDDEIRLIMYLAFDWLHSTGTLPERGRNIDKGFGELVRYVFEEVSNLKPDQALRRYWDRVPKDP